MVTWDKLKKGYSNIPESDKKKSEIVFYAGMSLGTGCAAVTLFISAYKLYNGSTLGWGIFAAFMTLLQLKQMFDNILILDELRKVELKMKEMTMNYSELNGK